MDVPARGTSIEHVWLHQAGLDARCFLQYQCMDQSLHDMGIKQLTSNFCKSSKCMQVCRVQRRPQQLGNLHINRSLRLWNCYKSTMAELCQADTMSGSEAPTMLPSVWGRTPRMTRRPSRACEACSELPSSPARRVGMTDSTALPPPLLKRMLKADAAACRQCNTSGKPVTNNGLMHVKDKVTLHRVSAGTTQDKRSWTRYQWALHVKEYAKDTCLTPASGSTRAPCTVGRRVPRFSASCCLVMLSSSSFRP